MTLEELDERDADELPSDEADGDEAELNEDDEDDADVEVKVEGEDEEEEEDLGEDEEDEDGQASLEELIAQRAAGRKTTDESDEAEDIMSLTSQADEPVVEPLPVKVAPVEEQKEFVCKSCYLVKPRVQLADAKREYCRDCV